MAKEINVSVNVQGLRELKKDLIEARAEAVNLANATDSVSVEKFQAATQRAGELKDQIADANEQIKIMSGGTDLEKIATGFGVIGGQILSLDFEGATKSMKNLTSSISSISFDGLKDGVKQVGALSNAFVQMGLKLLMNPLFLIVAVIGGIVVAIVLLKDKLKIAEQAFNLMTMPIKLLIQGLKDLTDWMGITAFAAEESADRQVAANNKMAESSKEATNARVAQLDREIKLAQAAGKDTTDLEIKKQDALIKGSKNLLSLARSTYAELDAIRKNGTSKLTEDQQKEFEAAANTIKAEKEAVLNSETEKLSIKISAETEAQKNADKVAAEAATKRKAEAEKRKAELEKEKQALKNIEQRFNDDIANINAKTDEDKLRLQKEREQKELDTIKLSVDAKGKAQLALKQKYALLEEQIEKDKQQRILDIIADYANRLKDLQAVSTEEKYNRQLEIDSAEEAKAIETLTKEGANAEQIQAVRDYYDQLAISRKKEFDKTSKDEADAKAESDKQKEEEVRAFKEKQYRDTYDNLQSIISLGGKKLEAVGKALAIADVARTAAQSISKSVSNLSAANAAAVAASPLTAGMPFVAINTVRTALDIGSTIATSIRSINAIKGDSKSAPSASGTPSSGGGGGGGSAPATPSLGIYGSVSKENTATSTPSAKMNTDQNITVTAVVSETEMTATQGRVANIQRSAEL